MVERLQPELYDPKRRLAILLIARHTPTPGETEADEDSALVASLKEHDAIITVATGRKPMQQVLQYLRPDLGQLSNTRFERIYRMSGGDLFLLNQVLDMIQSPMDVDGLDLKAIFGRVRQTYFGGAAVHLPGIMQIVVLVQFGLAPQIRFCPGVHNEYERQIIKPLVTRAGRPSRYYFLHSSLAELLFHALVDADGDSDESCIEGHVFEALMQYFQALSRAPAYSRVSAKPSLDDLQVLMRSRLKLISKEAEFRLRAGFLAKPEVIGLIAASLNSLTDGFLSLCLMLIRVGKPAAKQPFIDMLTQKILSWFPEGRVLSSTRIDTLHLTLRELRRTDEKLLAALQEKIGAGRFLALIEANGTLLELFKVLQYSTPAFAQALLDALDDHKVQVLYDKTIQTGRSIGAFAFTLKYLKKHAPVELARLEAMIGIKRWWQLIPNNGNLSDVIYLYEGMTDSHRLSFISAADDLIGDDWIRILRNGKFFEACRFVKEALAWFSARACAQFGRVLQFRAQELAASSNWFSLNTGIKQLKDVAPSEEIAWLTSAFQARLQSTQLDMILGLDFQEAANALECLWYGRPDLRPELARQLWAILSPKERWAMEKKKAASLRFAL